jgi:type II secretory ATPase GspE/PulE/Tfp pilus assembly ATPase PilB-like protein
MKEGVNKIFIEKSKSIEEKMESDFAYTSIFRESIKKALNEDASDIHIEPIESGLDIRLRVFGELYLWKRLGPIHKEGYIREVKQLCNLSIAIVGKTQDSSVISKDWKLKLRANVIPSINGDSIVLRLIDTSKEVELSDGGFSLNVYKTLLELKDYKMGLCVFSGPTGSGKSKTLNGVINQIDRVKKKVITLENPVEYPIIGATQVEIKKNLTFSDALRACMRQDPDVLLVGEIRDRETAHLAVEAAATGHLVFSTIHANSSIEVITRLVDTFGVDKDLLKSVLKFSSAQRLIQKVCAECSLPVSANDYVDLEINKGNLKRKNSKGCSVCRMGVVGRLPILESISGAPLKSFLENNFITDKESLFEDSIYHLARGNACIKEVMQIDESS